MNNSLSQISNSIDSINSTISGLGETGLREYILAAIALASFLASVVFYVLNRRYDRRRANEKYVATWGAVLTELHHALERIRYQTTVFLENDRQVNMFSIELTDGLRASYLSLAKHPKVASEITSLYINVNHFRNAYTEAIICARNDRWSKTFMDDAEFEYRLSNVIGPAIWIGQYRHSEMVISFSFCLEQYRNFVKESKVSSDLSFQPLLPINEKHRRTEVQDSSSGLRC